MNPLFETPVFKLYALAAAIVAVQMLLLALWTGTVRALRKKWVNPEDAVLNKGDQVELDHADVQRVKRAHQNLIENAVPFFAVGLLYALTGPSVLLAEILFFTFVGARLLHTAFYLAGKQPFRTMMFAIGVLTILAMAVQVIRAAV
jgi:glutathione S-transferase